MYQLKVGLLFCFIFPLIIHGQGIDENLAEDARLTTTGLLRKYGYPAEEHSVTTDDGYILEIHRVPGSLASPPSPGKRVAFVMHGMLSSSADFVLMGPNIGLAYMLADLGYDVWLGNARGNRYSTKHVSLDVESAEFWQFSWHEIGTTDLPNMIDYVLGVTGQQKLHYVGHSQGTTVFWVMCSERPEYNQKVIGMQALAAAAYMHHTRSPYVRWLATYLYTTELAFQTMGTHYFAPSDEMNIQAGEKDCQDGAPNQAMCANNIFLIAGFNSEELNMTMLPVIKGHSPAGASSRQMVHFGQIVRAMLFRQYDHGARNWEVYGQLYPPLYNLNRVTAPVAIYHSTNDWLAPPEDVQLLRNSLPNVILQHLVPMASFNHMDFVWAINSRTLLYNRVIQTMRSLEN